MNQATVLSLAAHSSLHHEITVNISAHWLQHFVVSVDQEVTVEVSPSSPHVLQFNFDNTTTEEDSYELYIESTDNDHKCLYVGINKVGCPWVDSASTVTNSRLWSRMIQTGYFPIKPQDFGSSFLVSLIPLEDSSQCYSEGLNRFEERKTKSVRLKLVKITQDYTSPISWSTISILTACLVFSLIWGLCWQWQQHYNQKTLQKHEELHIVSGHGDGDPGAPEMLCVENTSFSGENTLRRKLCETMEPVNTTRDKSKFVVNRILQDRLTLADMCRIIKEDAYHRRQRSKTYLYLIPLLSLFYLVPSSQMVFAEQQRAKASGNLEMCYLNYGCSRPFGIFDDFNHIISNSGYIIYGVTFVLLVKLKSIFLPPDNRTDSDHLGNRGLPQQHSLFYCMGLCMILQGVFSAIFHTCPSNISLQFDTTIMYVMLILVFIKTYQFRHPDISFNAYTIMYSFVIILFLEAVSLYVASLSGKIIFYSLFSVGYLLNVIHITVDCYFYGAVQTSFPHFIPVITRHVLSSRHLLYPKRFVLSLLFIFLNVCLLIYTLVRSLGHGPKSLSTPILAILSANVGLFLFYYMVRKFIEICESHEGEGTGSRKCMRFLSFVFFLLSLVIGACAMYFYTQKHQSRNRTPPESRYAIAQ